VVCDLGLGSVVLAFGEGLLVERVEKAIKNSRFVLVEFLDPIPKGLVVFEGVGDVGVELLDRFSPLHPHQGIQNSLEHYKLNVCLAEGTVAEPHGILTEAFLVHRVFALHNLDVGIGEVVLIIANSAVVDIVFEVPATLLQQNASDGDGVAALAADPVCVVTLDGQFVVLAHQLHPSEVLLDVDFVAEAGDGKEVVVAVDYESGVDRFYFRGGPSDD
jgi:hypothetical protein